MARHVRSIDHGGVGLRAKIGWRTNWHPSAARHSVPHGELERLRVRHGSPALVTPRSHVVAHSGKRRKGKYANYFEVGHNTFEFVADFGQYEGDDVTWHTRVIMNPSAARAFLDLLTESLEHFERRHGTTTNRRSSSD